LLVLVSAAVDDKGKSYYGNTQLYFIRADGREESLVTAGEESGLHDVQWNPVQEEFMALHDELPCKIELFDSKKGRRMMDFGRAHRNTIRWNPFGRFVAFGGFGQLRGDIDFWDKPGKKLLGSTHIECCTVCGWAPDGRHFLNATTAPRMHVDNKIEIRDYCGEKIGVTPFEELFFAAWRPRPRGVFQDRAPSPRRRLTDGLKPSGNSSQKKAAYRPPGARGGSGSNLAALLRQELGSTSAVSTVIATKYTGPSGSAERVPVGAAPPEPKVVQNRNARRKKAKEAARNLEEAARNSGEAISSPSGAAPKVEPVSRSDSKPAPEAVNFQASPADAEAQKDFPLLNDAVEKKVRALKKKLRDIQKIKEKPEKEIDKLQWQKIAGEEDIKAQIRELGAEPEL